MEETQDDPLTQERLPSAVQGPPHLPLGQTGYPPKQDRPQRWKPLNNIQQA